MIKTKQRTLVFYSLDCLKCEFFEGENRFVGHCSKRDETVSKLKECIDCKYEDLIK